MINGLEDHDLFDTISSRAVSRQKSKGEAVFREGETADFLPIVSKGRVKVFRSAGPGKEVILNIFEPGDMFAIPPVFDGGSFPASATALEESEILCLFRNDFLSLVGASEEFSRFVFERMSGLLRDTTQSVRILAINDQKKRIASVIHWLASKEGKTPYVVSIRRQDIAQIAGVATETAIRNIRALADAKIVGIENGKIVVDDLPGLSRFVND